MSRMHRAGIVLVCGVLTGGVVAGARAQATGMPLFTNPHFGTGIRIHADIGQPTDKGAQPGDLTVIQGGVTFALGPVGIGANVGALRNSIKSIQGCNTTTGSGCDPQTKVTGSALLQLRLMGGGLVPLSLSAFGGVSMDFSAFDAANFSTAIPQAIRDSMSTKELNIPVGAAIGIHVPLGVTSLNLWGAPRINMHKFVNCPSTNTTLCSKTTSAFRWAVGVDVPLFSIISIRGAYDSGKIGDQTVNYWGVGASIGLGGMR